MEDIVKCRHCGFPIEDTDIVTAVREGLIHVRCWRMEDSQWWRRVKPSRSALTDFDRESLRGLSTSRRLRK
jgi:hypothetical protein